MNKSTSSNMPEQIMKNSLSSENQSPVVSETSNSKEPENIRDRSNVHLTRWQILDATAICLHDYGYEGTTVRRIASKLGCAVGSVYRYFKDKRELLIAVTQRRFEPVANHVERGIDLDKAFEMYLRFATDEPEMYQLMYWLSSTDRTNNKGTLLPEVIQRIVNGWANQFGSRKSAEQVWVLLHGHLMLGVSCEDIIHQIDGMLATSPQAVG